VTPTLYIDADACPVKDEAYKVAARYRLKTFVVSNAFMRIPVSPLIEQVVVDSGPDVADDWIAERVGEGDIVVTNDIPLAERVLKAGGHALKPNGERFTLSSIGSAIAQRALMEQLRSTGDIYGGPKPFDRNDRSKFLQMLDQLVQMERRRTPNLPPS
jgi:uncharacterized protein YaiI (UPF0178 family)